MTVNDIVDAIYYPTLVVDVENLRVIYENDAIRELYDQSLVGKSLSSVIPKSIAPQITYLIGTCYSQENRCSEVVYINKINTNELLPVEISIGVFKDNKEYLLITIRNLKNYLERELRNYMGLYMMLRDINNLIISSTVPKYMLKEAVNVVHKSGIFPYVAITEKYSNRVLFEKGDFNKDLLTLCMQVGKNHVLTVSKPARNQFTLKELDLLEEIVYDLSFGLTRIEKDISYRERKFSDSTTGLPNRSYFLNYLGNAVEEAKAKKKTLVLALVDIDMFGEINQAFGYEAGDELLRKVAYELESRFKGKGFVGRIGADEFCVVVIDPTGGYGEVVRKAIENFSEPIIIDNYRVRITLSVGVAIYPYDSSTAEELYSNAELSLKEAKAEGGNTVITYSKGFRDIYKPQVQLRTDVKDAIENDEFLLYFQPKIELKSGKMLGAEALIRWKKNGELIPPMRFIPVIENSELINDVGRFVLEETCRQVSEWKEKGLKIPVAVNVSPKQLQRVSFTEDFLKAVDCLEDFELIEVEITESTIMEDTGKAITFLEILASQGIKSYIDDFGTGYSSLAYLKRLPVYAIKIDREFIKNLPEDKDSMELVKIMVAIAKNFGLKTLAEGIETEEQFTLLRELGCDYAQGYFFSKPLPPSELEDFYRGKDWT